MDAGRLLSFALLLALPPATEAEGTRGRPAGVPSPSPERRLTVAGVPLLNYDAKQLSDRNPPISSSVWMLMLKRPLAGDSPLQSICAALGAGCQWVGSPESGGAPIVVADASFQELEAFLKRNPGWASMLEFVERDGAVTTQEVPWHLNRVNHHALDLNGSYPGDPHGGRGVHVYVLDTGIRSTHVEFGGRAVLTWDIAGSGGSLRNCSESSPAALDAAASDHGVDGTLARKGGPSPGPCTPVSYGVDGALTKKGASPPPPCACAEDDGGHGTFVAGLVGGSTYGVAKGSTLHAVKVLDHDGNGMWSWNARALDLVTAVGQRPAVVVLSSGAPGIYETMKRAVDSTVAAGVTVVVAAGNYNEDACNFTPSYIPSAITVGASTQTDRRASFSNYGSCVDLFAPGVDLTSASYASDTAVRVDQGTSYTSPLVAGAAALRLSGQPHLTPSNVTARLQQTATSGVLADVGQGSPNLLLFAPVTP